MNDTPRGNRIHIAFFGLRNAGKSTLINAFTGQSLAIVSEVAGTTTDPVSKAMEILPLGPCLITDTAGLDDEGALGQQRVRKSLEVLATADIAVWVADGVESPDNKWRERFLDECKRRGVVTLDFVRGDSVEELKRKIAAVKLTDSTPALLDGLVKSGDRVLCIVPIDESAPKGRLILPQQQVIRECLELGAVCLVCKPEEAMNGSMINPASIDLAITDSQAFGQVKGHFLRLTSFSILFARQKGDLGAYVQGLAAIKNLREGDTALIVEGCTHHRQCNDIGAVKIPKALKKLCGHELRFEFASGATFPSLETARPAVIVHCGGCMLTRREVLRRIECARTAKIPIVNYGMVLAAANGLEISEVVV